MHILKKFKDELENQGHAHLRSMSMSQFMVWCTRNHLLTEPAATTLAALFEKERYQGLEVAQSEYARFSQELESAVQKSSSISPREMREPPRDTEIPEPPRDTQVPESPADNPQKNETIRQKSPLLPVVLLSLLSVLVFIVVNQQSAVFEPLLEELLGRNQNKRQDQKKHQSIPADTFPTVRANWSGVELQYVELAKDIALKAGSNIVFDTRLGSADSADIFLEVITDMSTWQSQSRRVSHQSWVRGHFFEIPQETLEQPGSSDAKLRLAVRPQSSSGKIEVAGLRITKSKKFTTSIDLSYSGLQGRGISFVDFDNDGDLDLFMATSEAPKLLENKHAAFEADLATRFGLQGPARAGQWGDYNQDGNLDLLITTGQAAPQLWNNSGGELLPAHDVLPVAPPYNLEGAGWFDHNLDGALDLLITNGQHGIFLLEQNNAEFVDKSSTSRLGPAGIGNGNGDFIVLADFNEDDYPDFVYNLGTGLNVVNKEGKGFQEADWNISFQTLGPSSKLGLSAADFDNDGDLDVFVPQPSTSLLYENTGSNQFQLASVERTGDAAFPAKSSTWEDLDEDGYLDLAVSTESDFLQVYRNTHTSFHDMTTAWGIAEFPVGKSGRGMMFADFDRDGDGDLAVSGDRGHGGVIINSTEIPDDRARINVRFRKPPPPGSKVQIQRAGSKSIQTRVLGIPENIGSQTPFEARFSVEGDQKMQLRLTRPGNVAKCFEVNAPSKTLRIIYIEDLEPNQKCHP